MQPILGYRDRCCIEEKAHDSTAVNAGPWLKGRLALLDPAYFKYRRFALIDENGGYFVSLRKDCANPVITAELRELRGDGTRCQHVATSPTQGL